MKRSSALILACAAAMPVVAAPSTYELDPAHTFPSLEFDHMGVSTWRGKFNETSGKVVLDREAKSGTVDVTIKTDSLDFGLDSMHEYAAKAEMLDFAKFPTATYRGKLVFAGDKPTAVDGELTFRGITKPVKLDLKRFTCIAHPVDAKVEICGGDAEAKVHWSDFGMQRYGDENSDIVTLHIQAEGHRTIAEPAAK